MRVVRQRRTTAKPGISEQSERHPWSLTPWLARTLKEFHSLSTCCGTPLGFARTWRHVDRGCAPVVATLGSAV